MLAPIMAMLILPFLPALGFSLSSWPQPPVSCFSGAVSLIFPSNVRLAFLFIPGLSHTPYVNVLQSRRVFYLRSDEVETPRHRRRNLAPKWVKHAYDFHTHTFPSDGSLSAMELIRMACVAGYGAIGITDHVGPGSLARAE